MSIIQNHAGICLTKSKLQLVEIGYRDDAYTLENVDEEFFKDFWEPNLKDTQLINILQNSFDEISLRHKLNSHFVSFTLPHEVFKVAELPFESTLLSSDLDDHLKWELATLFPKYDKDDFVVRTISKSINRNGSVNLIVVGLLKQYLKTVHQFCLRNNLALKYVDNMHTAATSLLQLFAEPDKKYLSLYLSESNFSIIITSGITPVFFRIYNINSSLDLDPKLKDVLEEIREKVIDFGEIDRFIMTGEPVPRHILPRIEVYFDITFRKLKPFENLSVSSPVMESEAYLTKSNTYTAAAGAAFRML